MVYEYWLRGRSKQFDRLIHFSGLVTLGLAFLLDTKFITTHVEWHISDWIFFGLHLIAAACVMLIIMRIKGRIAHTMTPAQTIYPLWDLLCTIVISNRNPYRLISRAERHQLKEEWDDAIVDLDRAIALYDKNDVAWTARGDLYREMEKYDLALADFDRAITLNPRNDNALSSRGDIYRVFGDCDRALVNLNQAIRANPKNGWALSVRGTTYRQLGQYADALVDFNRATLLDGKSAWTFAHRGVTYRDIGDYDNALADLDRAIQLNATADWYWQQRGQVHWRQSKFDLALADLKHAITLSGEDTNSQAWLAFVLLSMNRPDDARHSIENALAQPTPDAYTRFGRAATLALNREFDQAITLLKEVVAAEGEFRDEIRKSPIFDALRMLPEFATLAI